MHGRKTVPGVVVGADRDAWRSGSPAIEPP
jgi:hypothetical protein